MKYIASAFLFQLFFAIGIDAQENDKTLKSDKMDDYEIIRTESHVPGLKIALTHKEPIVISND